MPKPEKAARREAQQRKARQGMQVTNRSLKTTILPVIAKKAQPKEQPK